MNQDRSAARNVYSYLARAKKPAVAGAVIMIPLLVTFVVITWLLGIVANLPGTGIFEVTPFFHLNQTIKLFTLLFTGSLVVTGVGKLATTPKGFRIEEFLDSSINRIPLVRTVYNTAKVTTDTVLGGKTDFGSPVKIEMGEIKLTAFKTGNRTEEGRNIVFIPTSPNITSGFVAEIEDEWLGPTDETVSEAMAKVLSAGFGSKPQTEPEITGNQQI